MTQTTQQEAVDRNGVRIKVSDIVIRNEMEETVLEIKRKCMSNSCTSGLNGSILQVGRKDGTSYEICSSFISKKAGDDFTSKLLDGIKTEKEKEVSTRWHTLVGEIRSSFEIAVKKELGPDACIPFKCEKPACCDEWVITLSIATPKKKVEFLKFSFDDKYKKYLTISFLLHESDFCDFHNVESEDEAKKLILKHISDFLQVVREVKNG